MKSQIEKVVNEWAKALPVSPGTAGTWKVFGPIDKQGLESRLVIALEPSETYVDTLGALGEKIKSQAALLEVQAATIAHLLFLLPVKD